MFSYFGFVHKMCSLYLPPSIYVTAAFFNVPPLINHCKEIIVVFTICVQAHILDILFIYCNRSDSFQNYIYFYMDIF